MKLRGGLRLYQWIYHARFGIVGPKRLEWLQIVVWNTTGGVLFLLAILRLESIELHDVFEVISTHLPGLKHQCVAAAILILLHT